MAAALLLIKLWDVSSCQCARRSLRFAHRYRSYPVSRAGAVRSGAHVDDLDGSNAVGRGQHTFTQKPKGVYLRSCDAQRRIRLKLQSYY